MYPSVSIFERRPSNCQPFSINPDPSFTLYFRVLKEPKTVLISPKGSAAAELVCKLMVAPNAPAPSVEVHTPLWLCMFSVDEERSGRFTQKVPCDSGLFTGIPLMVTLMRFGSTPRILIPV